MPDFTVLVQKSQGLTLRFTPTGDCSHGSLYLYYALREGFIQRKSLNIRSKHEEHAPMRKFTWILLCVFVLSILASCVAARPAVAPPPLKNEARKTSPGPNYMWISGHWNWNGGQYVWISGHWEKNRKNQVWIPGHWEKRGRHYTFIKGHWRRR